MAKLDMSLAHSRGSDVILATLLFLRAYLIFSFYTPPLLWLLNRLLVAYPLATLNLSKGKWRGGGYSPNLFTVGRTWPWWVLAYTFGVLFS